MDKDNKHLKVYYPYFCLVLVIENFEATFIIICKVLQ